MTGEMNAWRWAMGAAAAAAAWAGDPMCEPWREPYTGAHATGAHVMALWTFSAGSELKDASPNGHDLKLQGAVISTNGLFGRCLESFRGFPSEDRKHAAVAANAPSLSPSGAFTLELWIRAKPDLEGYGEAFLFDKKYAGHTDYQLTLGAADKAGQRRLIARLGFGEDSATFTSDPARYETGAWRHVAFTYDGAGAGRFFRDGVSLGGGHHAGRGPVSPGPLGLTIGDRTGSYYHGFPGHIAQVRICRGVLEFRPITLDWASARTVFRRMEPAQPLKIRVSNRTGGPMAGGRLRLTVEGGVERIVELPNLEAAASTDAEYPFDFSLRPGEYRLRARVELSGAAPYASEEAFPVTIVARPLPHRMPVVMWGVYSPEGVLEELPRLRDLGFTHCLGLGADYGTIWEAGKPVPPGREDKVALARRMLDTALANDLGIIASLSPGGAMKDRKELLRVGRDGTPRTERPNVCGLTPGLSNFCYNVGASVAQAYGAFPAFEAALIHTEVRDAACLCYHEHDRAAYRAATGREMPEGVDGKSGSRFEKIKGFPESRIVPDDHPIYTYLKWYWKEGDGWNGLNTAVHRGLKSTGRADLWTFHDPAVRVASVYGSGGGVDAISQWTYSYPDPIRIGLATDELLAMAAGASQPQRVMKMTQIIWYRSQTAPASTGAATRAPSPWEDTDPDAAFITIAPMHLREAFWCKIARPVQGIMYHGWQSLVSTDGTASYRYTHPQTQHELRRLVKEVVEPLGPTLLQVPDAPADVAFLESFAAQVFAGRGTYGWGRGWGGDAWHVARYAGLQPEIIYDETVVRRGLGQYKVLMLMDCDVLTESVARRIAEFQKRGGIIVGDERLVPSIKPDVVVGCYTRTGKADADREALETLGEHLQRDLGARYVPRATTCRAGAVTRLRRYGTTDYLFAINDARDFGDYVGQHGLVMEQGCPFLVRFTVRSTGGNAYDLVEGCPVDAAAGMDAPGAVISFAHDLGPCEGRVFMITDRPIAAVKIKAPRDAKLGQIIDVAVEVVDPDGNPLDAVVPVRVDIYDPDGAPAEFSGYYGAKDGRLTIRLDLAANDRRGTWTIRAQELASRRRAQHFVNVEAPGP